MKEKKKNNSKIAGIESELSTEKVEKGKRYSDIVAQVEKVLTNARLN